MKDNFSRQADLYAQFRPTYPAKLFQFIYSLVNSKQAAWDCGTGNGQVAGVLAADFNEVYATDISKKQLANAVQKPNIFYSVQKAEESTFANKQFDLVTVAQAIHWFNFGAFYSEVNRTLKPGGLLAVIGYGLMETDGEVNALIKDFYIGTVGPFWDAERKYIDEAYKTIPFPFDEIVAPPFSIQYEWNIDQLLGYLSTWSSVQHYIKQNQADPVALLKPNLQKAWPAGEMRRFVFKALLRVGVKP